MTVSDFAACGFANRRVLIREAASGRFSTGQYHPECESEPASERSAFVLSFVISTWVLIGPRELLVGVQTKNPTITEVPLRIAGVHISRAGIKPVTGNLATLVKSAEVKDIMVRYGFQSQHPVLQAVLGILLVCLLPLAPAKVPLVTPALIGIWLFFNSFSRGYYLLIQTPTGSRKISLPRRAAPATIVRLCRELRHRKYVVVMDAIL
jgi:hypothetical protein